MPIGHKKGVRRCLTTEEMIAAEMTTNEKGWWILKAYDKGIVHKEDETEEAGEEAADWGKNNERDKPSLLTGYKMRVGLSFFSFSKYPIYFFTTKP